MVTSLSVKGQITIPKDVRDSFGLRSGDRLEIDVTDSEIRLRRADPSEAIDALIGIADQATDTDQLLIELRGPAWSKDLDPESL